MPNWLSRRKNTKNMIVRYIHDFYIPSILSASCKSWYLKKTPPVQCVEYIMALMGFFETCRFLKNINHTLDDFPGPSNHMRFLGPPKHSSAQKTHVIWWTHIFNLIGYIKSHEVSSKKELIISDSFCGSRTWGFFSCWWSLQKIN